MGLGDEIMASGRARVLHERTGKRVCIIGRDGSPRWQEIWDGVDFLSKNLGEDVVPLRDGPGCRPYIASAGGGVVKFRRSYRPVPGSVVIPEHFLGIPKRRRIIFVEPGFKGTNSADNKDWGWSNWVELSEKLHSAGFALVQVPMAGRESLLRAVPMYGQSLHELAFWVRRSRLVVTTEGGVHHMAAAVGTPAVVIWGGYTSPEFLGYPDHFNIFDEHDQSPCGRSSSCGHCRERMNAITVCRVESAILSALSKEAEIQDAKA